MLGKRIRLKFERAWERFVAWCARYRIPFRILATVVVFTSGSAASYGVFKGKTIWWPVGFFLLAAVAETVRELVGDELQSGRTTAARRRDARRILEIAGNALIPAGLVEEADSSTKLIRANAMKHNDVSDELRIWASYNMRDDEDRWLRIDSHSGVAGHVFWRSSDPHCFDRLGNTEDPRAAVRPVEAEHAVRDELQAILSVPVYHPYARGNRTDGPDDKIGVLNFDSDLSLDEIHWNQREIKDFAVSIADLIAVTLVE